MKLPLDILTANKTDNWVNDFVWPVSSIDLLLVRKDIESILFSIFHEEDDELNMSLLRATFNRLVVEHLSLLNALLVIDGFKSLGYSMDASYQSNKFGLFKSLIDTGVPQEFIFLPELLQRRSLKRYIRSAIDISKRFIHLAGKKKGNRNWSALMDGGIAKDLAEISGSTFFWMDRYDFFSGATFSKSKHSIGQIAVLADKVTDKIWKYFGSKKISMMESMRDNLHSFHFESFFRTSCFLNSSKNKDTLKNRNIWFGAGGVYFNRVIGELARKQNGFIVCHDHGESKALYDTTIHGYAELGLCDRYVTYTKDCGELYEKGWSNAMSLRGKMPEIDVSPVGAGRLYQSLRRNFKKDIRIKCRKIIYVSGGFDNDLNFYANRPHDMVYFEWQNWMLKAVNEMGYSVGVKYHPETLNIKRSILLGNTVEYLDGWFQDYLDRDDIFIFDTTCSTAFHIALCTSNPMVFIYCPTNEIHESVLKDLSGRVEIVRGFFDEHNRFRVSLDELASAIEHCDRHKNHDFVRKYIVES